MSIKVLKEKKEGYSGFAIVNQKGEQFKIHYAGGDLYWTMVDYCGDNEFVVERRDSLFYEELEIIFNLIGNERSSMEWVSEAYGEKENANKLLISRDGDEFRIKFYQNPNRMFARKDLCAICFCLSGSDYQHVANEFSLMFYRLFNKCKINKR